MLFCFLTVQFSMNPSNSSIMIEKLLLQKYLFNGLTFTSYAFERKMRKKTTTLDWTDMTCRFVCLFIYHFCLFVYQSTPSFCLHIFVVCCSRLSYLLDHLNVCMTFYLKLNSLLRPISTFECLFFYLTYHCQSICKVSQYLFARL
jgi:hypothetical protein